MSKVQAVPEGYHTVTPYLTIKGAAKAIDFYKKAFGAEELSRMPGPEGAVMHAEIKIGDSIVMVSDPMMNPPSVSSVFLYVGDVDSSFKRAVDAGATVSQPLADMFWGDRFGSVKDPFGINWSMATHKEDVAPAEMEKRMKAEMARQQQQKR
jgi:PhnB protein